MHAVLAGLAAGVGWVTLSFFTETLWPLGDWRWGVCAVVMFVVAGLVLWHKLRRNPRQKQPDTSPVGSPTIPPADTITPHGVLSMGPTGYPERLTTWEAMREGALAPPPGASPASPPIGPGGVRSDRKTVLDGPGVTGKRRPNWWKAPIKRLQWVMTQRSGPKPVVVNPGSTSLGEPTASLRATVVSRPKLWRNPIKWYVWKKTGSTSHL